jgi:hypothetical protein
MLVIFHQFFCVVIMSTPNHNPIPQAFSSSIDQSHSNLPSIIQPSPLSADSYSATTNHNNPHGGSSNPSNPAFQNSLSPSFHSPLKRRSDASSDFNASSPPLYKMRKLASDSDSNSDYDHNSNSDADDSCPLYSANNSTKQSTSSESMFKRLAAINNDSQLVLFIIFLFIFQ